MINVIIATFVQVQYQPVGTIVRLPEPCIRWLLKKAESIFAV